MKQKTLGKPKDLSLFGPGCDGSTTGSENLAGLVGLQQLVPSKVIEAKTISEPETGPRIINACGE